MIAKLKSLYAQVDELEREMFEYAVTPSGQRLLVHPLKTVKNRLAKILQRIEFVESNIKKGVKGAALVELAKMKRLKQPDRYYTIHI